MAIDFFSGNFVNVLNELGVKNFKKTKMKFSSKLKVSSDYYFVELLARLPVIQNKDMFSKPDVNKYCAEHNVNRNDLLDFSSDGHYQYGDFSKRAGAELFTVKGTRHFLVTEELYAELKSRKLKNVEFQEVPFLK